MITKFILSSSGDFGTRSISESYRKLINPTKSHEFELGFRMMGIAGWLEGRKFIRQQQSGILFSLFNAPILLAAMFGNRKNVRVVGILDWTKTFPSLNRSKFSVIYDAIYILAFSRINVIYSPSEGFREYYNRRGANILPCLYPLPRQIPDSIRAINTSEINMLFIGADYRRKGGDILLDVWRRNPPRNATLTFVCPHPPAIGEIAGVKFLQHIVAGTPEHGKLFEDHDILVLPTHEEPFGYVLLEAINSGMCTVTTRAAGAAQIVIDSGGFVHSSPIEACEAALRLATNVDQVINSKAKCFDYVKEYDHKVKASLLEIIESKI